MELYTITATDVPLSAGTAKTVLQLRTPSNRRARLVEWSVSFDGTVGSNTPVKVELMRQTSAGTGTGITPVAMDAASPAALCSAAGNHSAEPGYGNRLEVLRLTPNAGLVVIPFSVIREERPIVPTSSFVGIVCTAAQAVNVTAYIIFEE
jgi:hypothetical protein